MMFGGKGWKGPPQRIHCAGFSPEKNQTKESTDATTNDVEYIVVKYICMFSNAHLWSYGDFFVTFVTQRCSATHIQ